MGATIHDELVEKENEKENMEEIDVERREAEQHRYHPPLPSPPPPLPGEFHVSRMQRLSATNPLRLVMDSATRVASPSPSQPRAAAAPAPAPAPPPPTQPRAIIPTPQQQQSSKETLNSRKYTNKISLLLFMLHMVLAFAAMSFLIYRGVKGIIESGDSRISRKEKSVLRYFLPQVEASSLLSITLAFTWQKAVRVWPKFMVHFILWCSFALTLSAGILLICFQRPATDGVGVLFILFSVGNGLYACWVTNRTRFCSKIFLKALEPASKFPDINHPTYFMLGAGLVWMSLWILAVIGSFNFDYQPLVILALVLSLAWTTEVMRNIVNISICRVIALYYFLGVQSSTQFCLQRATSNNLGSASLGSLFVPAIEALRIVARGLNLLEGEDEFMFCCAHCSLKVLNSIFKRGNGWAYVQIAAYGKGFVKASQDTWELFESQKMEPIVDSDMTSAICFLTGVCSGSICGITVAAWTASVHPEYTATVTVLSTFIGYLLTRIAMALPHACVSCYYVCYAENPTNRLFDKTIPDRLQLIESGRDVIIPMPRVPGRIAR